MLSTGHGRKTDQADARSVGIAVHTATRLSTAVIDETIAALRARAVDPRGPGRGTRRAPVAPPGTDLRRPRRLAFSDPWLTPSMMPSPAGTARIFRSSLWLTVTGSAIPILTGRSRARSRRTTGASGCRACARAGSSPTSSTSAITGRTYARSPTAGSTRLRSWGSSPTSRCRTGAEETSSTSSGAAGTASQATTASHLCHPIPCGPISRHCGRCGDPTSRARGCGPLRWRPSGGAGFPRASRKATLTSSSTTPVEHAE